MKFLHVLPFAAVAALSVPGVAFADPFAAGPQLPAVGVQISTLGAGFQLAKPLGFATDVRVASGNLELNRSGTTDGFAYIGNGHLRNISALFDFRPMRSAFRLTAGLLFSHDGADVTGTPQDGAYTFNGHTYSASQVGNVNGSIHFGNLAPYVGIGFGQPRHARVFLTGDFGVALRNVQTSLTATGPATALPQFTTDLAQTRRQLNSAANILRTYPVVSLGLATRM
jgi:hypothetical protein